jgi:hypothetical protein
MAIEGRLMELTKRYGEVNTKWVSAVFVPLMFMDTMDGQRVSVRIAASARIKSGDKPPASGLCTTMVALKLWKWAITAMDASGWVQPATTCRVSSELENRGVVQG